MRLSRVAACVSTTLTALLLVSGCSDTRDGTAAPPSEKADDPAPSTSANKRVSHDPPRGFDLVTAVALPDSVNGGQNLAGTVPLQSVALYEALVYAADYGSLQAINTTTGEALAKTEPSRPVPDAENDYRSVGDTPPRPVVTTGETPLVALPFVTEVPASGTTPARKLVELVVMEADSAKARKPVEVELPDWARTDYDDIDVALVGSFGNLVVLSVVDDAETVSYGIDLDRVAVAWKKEVQATGVAGKHVVALDTAAGSYRKQHLLGLDVASGKTTWTSSRTGYGISASAAGPELVWVSGEEYGDGDDFAALLDARTGASRNAFEGGYSGGECTYDDKSTVVCSSTSLEDSSFGFDATSGKLLWRLPDKDANRVSPSVTAAWHGIVYGTTKAGPVLLDARTGKDIAGAPGIAPVLANDYTGIAEGEDRSTIMAYRSAR